MAFARFNREGSAVYAFYSGVWECMHKSYFKSKLGGQSFVGMSAASLANHLEDHVKAGDNVPGDCLTAVYEKIEIKAVECR